MKYRDHSPKFTKGYFEAYDNTPNINGGSIFKIVESQGEKMEVWKDRLKTKDTYICRMKHPSAGNGFNKELWSKLFNQVKLEILNQKSL
jgi:hypothetical protein